MKSFFENMMPKRVEIERMVKSKRENALRAWYYQSYTPDAMKRRKRHQCRAIVVSGGALGDGLGRAEGGVEKRIINHWRHCFKYAYRTSIPAISFHHNQAHLTFSWQTNLAIYLLWSCCYRFLDMIKTTEQPIMAIPQANAKAEQIVSSKFSRRQPDSLFISLIIPVRTSRNLQKLSHAKDLRSLAYYCCVFSTKSAFKIVAWKGQFTYFASCYPLIRGVHYTLFGWTWVRPSMVDTFFFVNYIHLPPSWTEKQPLWYLNLSWFPSPPFCDVAFDAWCCENKYRNYLSKLYLYQRLK